jgi:ABC-2 type transport system ATP-binding protein
VSDLCPNMAIINKGEVLLTGRPNELIASLRGRVWSASVPRADLEDAKKKFPVISTRLIAGQTLIHVISDSAPSAKFESIEPTLEDAYFAAIGGFLGSQPNSLQRAAA